MLVSIPIAIIFDRLRLPVIIGFMIAGVLIGPFGFGLIRDVAAVESLAEIGVVLLLFTIGLEFSLRRIIEMKRLVLWGGGLQVVLTTLLIIGITYMLGRPFRQEVFFGFLFALSSTAIVLKTYMDRAEMDTPHGKAGVGILLFQDLCIVPMMLMVPIHDYQIFLASAIISMIATPFLIEVSPKIGYWLQSLLSPYSLREPTIGGIGGKEQLNGHVVIVGYGLNGRNVSNVLQGLSVPFVVLELNPEVMREAASRGVPILYGDSTRKAVLDHTRLEHARILVVAISDPLRRGEPSRLLAK